MKLNKVCSILFCFGAVYIQSWFEIFNPLNEAIKVKVFFTDNTYREFIVSPNAATGKLYANPNNTRDISRIARIVFEGTVPVVVGWDYNIDEPGNNWGKPITESKKGQFVVDNPKGLNVKVNPLRLRIMEITDRRKTSSIRDQLPAIYDQWYSHLAIGGSSLSAVRI